MSFLRKFWWIILLVVLIIILVVAWPSITRGMNSALSSETYSNANDSYAGYNPGGAGMTPEEVEALRVQNELNKKHDAEVKLARIAVARESAWNYATGEASKKLYSDIESWKARGDSNKMIHDWLTDMYAYDKPWGRANNVPIWLANYEKAAKLSMPEWQSSFMTSPSIVEGVGASSEFNTIPASFNSASLTTWY